MHPFSSMRSLSQLFRAFTLCIFIFFQTDLGAKEKEERGAIYPNFDDNPFLSKKMRGKLFAHLLPLDHPAKPALDQIFLKRVTLNFDAFCQAGFKIVSIRPSSFILVASHIDLPNYLVKVYLDDERRLKHQKEGWRWFICRCKGADQIRKVIARKKMKHFVVPKKWIYPLPVDPAIPNDPHYSRKQALLLVEKMNLVSSQENIEAWKTKITHRHLEELYAIISRAQGSSYRPDNVSYTREGKFAFIDTEYPGTCPNYNSIKPYLSSEMLTYWEVLVRAGKL